MSYSVDSQDKNELDKSELERALETHLLQLEIRNFVAEFRFHPERDWRFDFAFVEKKIAVECEGGTWSSGRHTRGSGFEKDCYKYNQAAADGWMVLRFTSSMIRSWEAVTFIEKVISDLK